MYNCTMYMKCAEIRHHFYVIFCRKKVENLRKYSSFRRRLDDQIWGSDEELDDEQDENESEMKDEEDGKGSKEENETHNDLDGNDKPEQGEHENEGLDAANRTFRLFFLFFGETSKCQV